jgi:multidrug efflux pump subunit AcrA (membrane-fusion protein)
MKLFSKLNKIVNKKTLIHKYSRLVNFIKRRPIISFLGSLLLLFIIILIGSIISSPAKTRNSASFSKSVQIYKIGVAPRIVVQAKIEKSGVIKITALTGGIISEISVSEGENIFQGQNLLSLSSNYSGGNALALSAQIAQKQYQNVLDTYQEQKDIIQRQRDLANSAHANAQDLRNIADQSLNEIHNLANLNQDIVNSLSQNLNNYTATNSAGQNNSIILQTKQLESQFQSAVNSLNQASRSAQYQSSNSNPPADIANEQRDIALKQLNIQEKALDLNKEVSRLQSLVAQVNLAMMYPVAPFAGKVERIYVKEGTAVNPGTPLLLISGNSKDVNAIALISGNIAKNISQIETSILYLGNQRYSEHPFYISDEATDGQLYSAGFTIPENLTATVTDGDFISVSIPIGLPDTGGTIPFIPLDAIFQSQSRDYLFLAQNGKAVSRNITLGQVYGRFVEIKSGLKSGDQVILNRNIIAGDPINQSN